MHASDNDKLRRDVLKRVLRSLNYEGAKDSLPVTNDAGERPIVIALLGDTYGSVIDQADAHDGAANVIIPKDNVLYVLELKRVKVSELSTPVKDDPWHIDGESSIEMVLAAVEQCDGSLITTLTKNSIELTESGHPLYIPA